MTEHSLTENPNQNNEDIILVNAGISAEVTVTTNVV
jgi:hypothetical protein